MQNSERVHVPLKLTKHIQQSTSPFFQQFPSEIRHQIYSYLLVSDDPIQDGQPKTGSVSPKYDIHPNILRTCRDVYNEALPILYEDNVFQFAYWSEMYSYDQTPDVPALNQSLECPYSASRSGKLYSTRRLSFPVHSGDRFVRERMDVIPVSPSCVAVDKEQDFGACHSFIGHFPHMKVLSSGFKPWILAEGKAEVSISSLLEVCFRSGCRY